MDWRPAWRDGGALWWQQVEGMRVRSYQKGATRNRPATANLAEVSSVCLMSSESVLIVGASRGIGSELARRYLADGHTVHATVRDLADPMPRIDGRLYL